jgi:hypothetical protein
MVMTRIASLALTEAIEAEGVVLSAGGARATPAAG